MPKHKLHQKEPICALATPAGRGALAIVRLSGRKVLEIANQITNKNLTPRHATFTTFLDDKKEIIDSGIAVFFKSPESFTAEDMVEFYCHGNPVVADLILKTLCEFGARLANPGEFSLRAFLNNKINLAQAEAIADLINCTTEQGVRTASRSLQGEFSNRVNLIDENLIQIRTNIEAHLDFPDEEIDADQIAELKVKLKDVDFSLDNLFKIAQQGERLQTGASVAIAGKPNVGKSSLLNSLAQSDIAIVTEIPGTTRDPLIADVNINGIPVRLIDTAGIRETQHKIEMKGIERAHQNISQADIILWLTDVSLDLEMDPIPAEIDATKVIRVHNKIDLVNGYQTNDKEIVPLSVKTGQGMQGLLNKIYEKLIGQPQGDTPFLARRRHLNALQQANENIAAALIRLDENRELELAAEELRLAQQELGEITGEFSSDDLLGRIFSEFCIGK